MTVFLRQCGRQHGPCNISTSIGHNPHLHWTRSGGGGLQQDHLRCLGRGPVPGPAGHQLLWLGGGLGQLHWWPEGQWLDVPGDIHQWQIPWSGCASIINLNNESHYLNFIIQVQALAAGFAEGYLTKQSIYNYYQGILSGILIVRADTQLFSSRVLHKPHLQWWHWRFQRCLWWFQKRLESKWSVCE